MTRPTRVRRVELSVPGTSEKMITKSAGLGADLVFLDLEDSVAPQEKEGARATIVSALNDLDFGRSTRGVRINPVGTRWCHGDLIELVEGAGARIDVVIIPKVMGPRDVWFVDTLLTELETRLRLPHRIGIEVLIEEAQALARIEEIAACCERTEALILGVGDLSASLGMRLGHIGEQQDRYPGDIWHAPRSRLIAAARANGLDPVDGPYANFRNADGFRREATWASAMGCVGKWAIHPSQVELAHEVFAPTHDEVTKARAAIDAMHAAEAGGSGAANLGGLMIDAATTRIFQGVLDRAALIAGGSSAAG